MMMMRREEYAVVTEQLIRSTGWIATWRNSKTDKDAVAWCYHLPLMWVAGCQFQVTGGNVNAPQYLRSMVGITYRDIQRHTESTIMLQHHSRVDIYDGSLPDSRSVLLLCSSCCGSEREREREIQRYPAFCMRYYLGSVTYLTVVMCLIVFFPHDRLMSRGRTCQIGIIVEDGSQTRDELMAESRHGGSVLRHDKMMNHFRKMGLTAHEAKRKPDCSPCDN